MTLTNPCQDEQQCNGPVVEHDKVFKLTAEKGNKRIFLYHNAIFSSKCTLFVVHVWHSESKSERICLILFLFLSPCPPAVVWVESLKKAISGLKTIMGRFKPELHVKLGVKEGYLSLVFSFTPFFIQKGFVVHSSGLIYFLKYHVYYSIILLLFYFLRNSLI